MLTTVETLFRILAEPRHPGFHVSLDHAWHQGKRRPIDLRMKPSDPVDDDVVKVPLRD